MKNKKNFTKFLVLLILLPALLLQGCRPSTAIRVPNNEQKPGQQVANIEQLSQSEKAKEEDKRISPNKQGDSNRKNQDKKKVAVKKNTPENNKDNKGAAPQYVYSEDGTDTEPDNSGTSTGGDGSGTSANGLGKTGTGEATESGTGTEGSGNPPPAAGPEDEKKPPSEESAAPPPPVEPAPEEKRQVFDANGQVLDIPKNVERVSAVGEAASSAVHMLGGTGRLVATSADYKSNTIASSIFNDLNSIPALWSSSTAGITDANFQSLLQKKPQVCFYISGTNAFTAAQLNTLKANNITPLLLPSPNIPTRLKQLVTIVGKVMGDRNGINGEQLASQYNSYFESTISGISNKVKPAMRSSMTTVNFDSDEPWKTGTYIGPNESINPNPQKTVFITDWDASASFKWFPETHYGSNPIVSTGAAVAKMGSVDSPLTYYMSKSGIQNWGIGGGYPEYGNDDYITKYMYISTVGGNFSVDGSYGSATRGSKNSMGTLGSFTWPGDSKQPNSFVTLIAANNSVKNAIESEKNRDRSPWKYYDDSTQVAWSFKDGDYSYHNYVGGAYNIYVNPKGAASWTEGTPESILESLWLLSKFYPDKLSDADMKAKVKDFYKTFYRYDVSNSMLNRVLNGPAN